MRSLRAMLSGLESTPLNEWGHFRWHEGQVPAQYTCNRTKEPWLLGFAKKLRTQGVNFEALMAADDARAAAPRCGL